MRIAMALILYVIAQAMAWFQTNALLLNKWTQDNIILITIGTAPIFAFLFAFATKLLYQEMESLWSVRFITFGVGYLVFIPLTWYYFGEQIFTIKNAVSFLLCVALIGLQFIMK